MGSSTHWDKVKGQPWD